ncbi:MAG: polyprenyl synthetase family protein [Ignavibacteria bacterium]|nr:polyprenyl synthetase family protein [Ignavibacteria bacterium]
MDKFINKYNTYKREVENIIRLSIDKDFPTCLYQPIKYILDSGGKKLRPILTLFVCEALEGNYKNALFAASAIEILHTFTLVHDDIMDNADTRRGRETVHKKWDRDTAILVGDQLLAIAYKTLLKTQHKYLQDILNCFTNGIIEVCEGQALDKDFEARNNITTEEYLLMIEKKTAKLLEASAEIGVIIANVNTKKYKDSIKNFALNLGIAFQLQDDLLDIIGDEKKFGKTIGGDIKQGKKTFLLIKALELATQKQDREKLLYIINQDKKRKLITDKFISEIKEIYIKYKVINITESLIKYYITSANSSLMSIKSKQGHNLLKWFSNMLLERKY